MKNQLTTIIYLMISILWMSSVFGQSAILDVSSNSQGALMPRMTENQRNNIVNPAFSLLVFQTNGESGYYYNQGSPSTPVWRRLATDPDTPCESRIPIDTLPFTISTSGSYIIVGNLLAPTNQDGIIINTSHVSVNLNGYAISSAGGGSGFGILVSNASTNIEVKNGTVHNWPDDGISAFLATNSNFSHLKIENNQGDGLVTGKNCSIDHCISNTNLFDGIDADHHSIIEHCIASNNSDDGIEVSNSCIVNNCTSQDNNDNGFNTGTGCTLRNNTSTTNGDRGYVADNGSTLYGNIARTNTSHGFDIGAACFAQMNVSRANTGHGYSSDEESSVDNNLADNNSLAGYQTNASKVRFENNQSTSNGTYGYDIQGLGDCVIIRNTAISNTLSNFNIAVGNSAGPIIGPSLSSATNPFSNISL